MDLFPLTIFPEGGLASSIITTVWVGVFVMCFFNLRYGWVLSGLVVPGYLVPLVIVKPWAAAVIVVEAVLAYLIVWVFSEKISRGRYPSLFGRDRFMGLILASIAVRLVLDGWLLPEFATWMEDNFDRRIDWQDNLQSFGLIIISLLANLFWKPGLARGLFGVGVAIALTYVIVRFGLMEITNFRISGVYYLYEGLASSILASPKAYIILTLTALIASHYNVKYGWDFSGILIPALIALQWYQPSKIVTSFAEAIVIYVIARLILKLPIMANVTLEGGRKLLLFFNISFAWKMAVGWYIVWQGMDVKTTDFFGFGYLLSTLIAIKAHDKDIFPRLARSTLQVSLAGAVLGNIVGFTLSAATNRTLGEQDGEEGMARNAAATPRLNALMVQAVGDAHVRAVRGSERPLSDVSAQNLAELIEQFESGTISTAAAAAFDQSVDGWRVLSIENGMLAIVRDDGRGHELLVFDPAAQRNLAIILPDPTDIPGLAIAAAELQRNQSARWLIFGAPAPVARLADRRPSEIFESSSESAQIIVAAASEGTQSRFDFSDNTAALAEIAELRGAVPDLEVALAMEGRGAANHNANLLLSQAAIEAMAQGDTPLATATDHNVCRLAPLGGATDRWDTLEQLAYLRFEVAEPFVAGARVAKRPITANAAAQLGGMSITSCQIAGKRHWRLAARDRAEGNIFLAEGEAPEKGVLGYRRDRTGRAPRISAAIHRRWESDALFVAPLTDFFLRDSGTIFDVVWQEWVRSQEGVEDPMIFQLRAPPREITKVRSSIDVLVTNDRIGPPPAGLDDLMSSMRLAGLRPELVDNSRSFAGLETRPGMATRYFDETSGRRYTLGWLMPLRKRRR